jgi:hypothetical protein
MPSFVNPAEPTCGFAAEPQLDGLALFTEPQSQVWTRNP